MPDLWDDAGVVSRYTRAQAIEDGVLVDVSPMAREAGITVPTAITAGLWADVQDIPPSKSHQDPQGRLWDVLSMFVFRAKRATGPVLTYRIIMHVGRWTYYTVKAHIGPGDEGEPVLTLLREDED